VWWGSNGFDTVYFNSFGIPTGRNGGTTLEGGGGVTGKLTRNVGIEMHRDAAPSREIAHELECCAVASIPVPAPSGSGSLATLLLPNSV
jgi:hypothetical protein